MPLFYAAILAITLLSTAGCASVGNPKIMELKPEQLQGMTKAQLIEAYGDPNMKQTVYKDGKQTDTYTWSYAFVAPGYVESAAFAISFDESGTVSTVTMRQP